MSTKKRTFKKRDPGAYRSYIFKGGQDPMLAEVCRLIEAQHHTNMAFARASGVSAATIAAWRHKKRRTAFFHTLNAVSRTMGFELSLRMTADANKFDVGKFAKSGKKSNGK